MHRNLDSPEKSLTFKIDSITSADFRPSRRTRRCMTGYFVCIYNTTSRRTRGTSDDASTLRRPSASMQRILFTSISRVEMSQARGLIYSIFIFCYIYTTTAATIALLLLLIQIPQYYHQYHNSARAWGDT